MILEGQLKKMFFLTKPFIALSRCLSLKATTKLKDSLEQCSKNDLDRLRILSAQKIITFYKAHPMDRRGHSPDNRQS